MTKEQIVKTLETCAEREVCGTCPFDGKCGGMEYLLENALTLIREQEKRIEELTLEKAGFEAGAEYAAQTLRELTVIKMQSEIESRCIEKGIYPVIVKRVVDEVAKEMLEELNDGE